MAVLLRAALWIVPPTALTGRPEAGSAELLLDSGVQPRGGFYMPVKRSGRDADVQS